MRTDLVSGTFNQIPTSDETMDNLNNNGIYRVQNSQKLLCVKIYILNHVLRECQITNKVNKEDNANIDFEKTQAN